MQKSISGLTVKSAEKGQVSAVFSTFNVVDKDGDVTLPGAIKDGTEVVISAYGHGSHTGMLPVGKGVLRTSDTEAILDGQFFLNTTAGRDTFEVVKELGGQQEWSYSLHNVKASQGDFNGQPVQFLESIGTIKEVSPVLIGAGVNTRTLSTKGLKFSEEGDAVMAAVNAYLDRAGEVMALRAEKGRGLGDDSVELLKQIDEATQKLHDLLDIKADNSAEVTPEETPDDVKAIAAEALRRELFSNLNEGA